MERYARFSKKISKLPDNGQAKNDKEHNLFFIKKNSSFQAIQ
jgi:hypothetical protein